MSKVLLVEDSPTQRAYISDILTIYGLTVMVARDGIEALEQTYRFSPDLVLLDIVMPRMNGYEVCRRLKSEITTQNVPVVIYSLKQQDFDRYWGIKQGADAYLSKSVQKNELISTIRQFLRF